MSRGGTFDVTNLPAAVTSTAYDANNRLTDWGTKTLTYDADGNLTGDGTNTYTWNTRNQLINIAGGSTGSFVYDGLGRRESETIGGTTTNFLYDGLNLEQELNGTTPTANYLTGAGIDETLSRTDSSGTYSYLTDNLGSTDALTNASGAISTSYSYEPYGNTTASGASSTNALQYTGRENDGDGLYYNRARYYSPIYSRFVSEDPIGFAGRDTNLYGYAANDPVNFIDPSGLYCFSNATILAIAGGAGGAVAGGASLSETGPGAVLGSIVGGIGGAIAGYFSADTAANNAAMGAIAGATSSGSQAGPGAAGGAAGGLATYGLQQVGVPSALAVPAGGAAGGVASAAVAEAVGLAAKYAEGGAIGAAAGATTVAVAAALAAGNNCGCGHKP